MLILVRLKEDGDELLLVWRQGLEEGRLEQLTVDQKVMEGVIQHGGLDAGEVALKHQGVLLLRRLGLVDHRLRPQVMFRGFAPGFQEISRDGVQFRWV